MIFRSVLLFQMEREKLAFYEHRCPTVASLVLCGDFQTQVEVVRRYQKKITWEKCEFASIN